VCNLVFGSIAKFLVFLDAARLFNFHLSEENLAVRLEKMGDHLTTICTLSRALGATPVLCTYLYDEQWLRRSRGEEFLAVLDRIDDTIQDVAEETGAVLVEANDQMKGHPEYFLDDFHLNAEGGKKFAEILVKGLEDKNLLPQGTTGPGTTRTEPME
jgi:lysophospholipase L1-like esterase